MEFIEELDKDGNGNPGDQFVIVTKTKNAPANEDYNYMTEHLGDRNPAITYDNCAHKYKFIRNDLTMIIGNGDIIEAEIVNNNSTKKVSNMKLILVNPNFKIVKFKFSDWTRTTDIEQKINEGGDIRSLGFEKVTNDLCYSLVNQKIECIKMLRAHVFKNMGLAEAKAYIEQQAALGFTEIEVRNWR